MRLVLALTVVALTVIAVSTLPFPGGRNRTHPDSVFIGSKRVQTAPFVDQKRDDGVEFKRAAGAPGNCNNKINIWNDKTVRYAMCSPDLESDTLLSSAINTLKGEFAGLITFEKVECGDTADHISIESTGSGCWSYVGKTSSNSQTLNLQTGSCDSKGVQMHEFLHAIGALHEQQRGDRGSHVNIQTQNIKDGMESQFAINNDACTQCPYQTCSVMHYSSLSFSKNKGGGLETLVPSDPSMKYFMGAQLGLSASDICEVYKQYGLQDPSDCTSTCKYGTDFYGNFKCCRCPAGLAGPDCGQLASNAKGERIVMEAGETRTVSSPNFPDYYNINEVYNILIEAPAGKRINYSFTSFAVEPDVDCYWDQFHMWDGNSILDCPYTLCGYDKPDAGTTSSNFLFLVLKSDDMYADAGFEVNVEVVN